MLYRALLRLRPHARLRLIQDPKQIGGHTGHFPDWIRRNKTLFPPPYTPEQEDDGKPVARMIVYEAVK